MRGRCNFYKSIYERPVRERERKREIHTHTHTHTHTHALYTDTLEHRGVCRSTFSSSRKYKSSVSQGGVPRSQRGRCFCKHEALRSRQSPCLLSSSTGSTTTSGGGGTPTNTDNHGALQLQGHGLEGPEEDPEQHGDQSLRPAVHRRHHQRDPGRALPRLQGILGQQDRGPQGGQGPNQDRRQDRPLVSQQPLQHRGADLGPGLQKEAAPGRDDRHQFLRGGLHLRQDSDVGAPDGMQGPPAAAGQQPPDAKVPRAHQPRVQPLRRPPAAHPALPARRALPEQPGAHLQGTQQAAGGRDNMTVPPLPSPNSLWTTLTLHTRHSPAAKRANVKEGSPAKRSTWEQNCRREIFFLFFLSFVVRRCHDNRSNPN